MCFVNARRPAFAESNPTFGPTEVVSALAKVWNNMTPEQKKQYDKISEEDAKRF